MTEQHVFTGIFGKDGLLAQLGTTIILATHGGKLGPLRVETRTYMNLVHRLSEADHIVVLGKNGQILEQGSYSSLSISEDYVQSLAKTEDGTGIKKNSESQTQAREQPMVPPPQVGTTDSSRQTGDWKIYVYYSKSLGLLGLAAFSLLVAVECTLMMMQCEYTSTIQLGQRVLTSSKTYG